ncbi:ferritin light chain 1-like [Suncus etruscus]|uniref:ferritin light chain 1-like n=1 Tax=Suncus etruscus TaxID=109475 RepID=UPI00210F62B5|nr:ferritin light chain 1-like [Suncus etruscus]
MSEIRQNYSTEAEIFVNLLTNLHIVFTYLSMSFYFSRENGFPESLGFFFLRLAKEKYKGMQKLLELQNDRGGLVIFYTVSDPPQDEWGTILQAMESALALEKKLNQSFLELHEIGMVHKDPHVSDHPTPSLRGSLQA